MANSLFQIVQRSEFFEFAVRIPMEAFPWLTLIIAMIILLMCLVARKGNNNGKSESGSRKERKRQGRQDASVDEG